MIGYIGIVAHPYFAVTGDDGSFSIDGVPPGKYVLEAWQERLGAITKEVQVREGETATVDFEFTGPTKKASSFRSRNSSLTPTPPSPACSSETLVE